MATAPRPIRITDSLSVWASVLDSAKESEDQGTFWAAEDRSWLWYNDTIETHAFALRTLTSVSVMGVSLIEGDCIPPLLADVQDFL